MEHDGAVRLTIDVSPFTIGRWDSNTLTLKSAEVSRQHAEIVQQGERYLLRDRQSRYGTWVNGVRISSITAVAPTDRVTLGQAEPLPWPALEPSRRPAPPQAVAPRTLSAGIGLDVEPAEPMNPELLPQILREPELARLDDWPERWRDFAGILAFSAKEALYKSIYPAHRVFLEFHDVELHWSGFAPGIASKRAVIRPSRMTRMRWARPIVSSSVSEVSTTATPSAVRPRTSS